MSPPQRILDPELTILGGRDLVGLCGRLIRERSWETLATLFSAIGAEDGLARVSLTDLDTAARLVQRALGEVAPPKNPRAALADELRTLRLATAGALLASISRPALGDLERGALERAAVLLGDAGDHRRAALAFEALGDDPRAAEAWGALGDLERMEVVLEREERRASARRAAADAVRHFETLLTGGERRAALIAFAEVAPGEDAASTRALAARVASRLCRGPAVSLRAPGGASVRVGGLPATLGRDAAVEIPLRDPAVSRRHALLRASAGGVTVEDAGSRGGVRIAGARLDAPLVLHGTGELGLGGTSLLRFSATRQTVLFEGIVGLDRPLRALVGTEPVPLFLLYPEADGLSLAWSSGGARLLRRPDIAVRIDGHFIGPGCDLLHGDVIEVVGPRPLRLEVE